MKITVDTIGFRLDQLIAKDFADEVEEHILNNLVDDTRSDIEVACILCIKYFYFLRNKAVHAEQNDFSFRIIPENKEEESLVWGYKILLCLVFDLINSYDLIKINP